MRHLDINPFFWYIYDMVEDNDVIAFERKIPLRKKLVPLSLTLIILIIDQYVKFLVVKYIPIYNIGLSLGDDVFRIIHVQNSGIAFSVGDSLPATIRWILFLIVPLCVVVLVLVTYFQNDDFTPLQHWTIAGVVGGGLGNLIDRFVRADGVVDFIDIKFYGLFGLERWPTFNIADMSVLICAFIFMFSILLPVRRIKKSEKKS
jgi:signal peptidase II